MSFNLATLPDGRKAFIMRTSDRINFKRCRRRWAWSSHVKRNLGPKHLAAPLWFGSAIHYALEDFHGYKHFETAAEAFLAFCVATAQNHNRELPLEANDLIDMGNSMMDYYQHQWLKYKPADETYWENGIPQVEVTFEIPIPVEPGSTLAKLMEAYGIDVILYRGTFDRIVIDEYGNLWVDEYKTAKRFEHGHYATDPQISTYIWAASLIYNKPVAGVIYHQFLKTIPEMPKILASGKVSTASTLVSSYPLYRQRLIDLYGEADAAPAANKQFLWDLAASETADKDRYIVRERIYRNDMTSITEFAKIQLELEDMINGDLPLYPNPTRDCSWQCSFESACISFDDGSDWELELNDLFSDRDQDAERYWRRRIPDAAQLKALKDNSKSNVLDIVDVQFQARGTANPQKEDPIFGL